MVQELFIEIGCEEIPARFLEGGLNDLARLVRGALEELDLSYGVIRTAGTPRRMAISVSDVPERRQDMTVEKIGPAKSVAFDMDGNPTQAAIGFARSQGVGVGDLSIVETDKGKYVAVKKWTSGRDTRDLLADSLPDLIQSIPWPKSMKWGEQAGRFVRPVHWIVALFGAQVVPLKVFGLESGNATRGHRFLSPTPVEVRGFEDYVNTLRGSNVITLIAERREIIENELARIGRELDAAVVPNPWLVEHNANLVEFPVALTGAFDAKYLELPREVLETTLRDHQNYFVVEGKDGNLLPRFVAISNMLVPDPSIVVKGNERVLAARLEDAKFYFQEDLKKPLEKMAERLAGVLFQADLGTYTEKTERIRRVAIHLAKTLAPDKEKWADRAASLAKADLVSGMVGQFPELQGVMGMHYARCHNEPDEIAEAIREHYLPQGQSDQLPKTETGAIVALADKFDTICGCFGVGLGPTGSGDPFALRRAALGVIRILADRNWTLNLPDTIGFALKGASDKIAAKGKKAKKGAKAARAHAAEENLPDAIVEFFRQRLANLLKGDGLATSAVDAVLAVRFVDLAEVKKRAEAVSKFAGQEQFEPFAVAFKRVANILADATDDFANAKVAPQLFDHDTERELFEAVKGIESEVEALVAKGDHLGALNTIARIRPQVDKLFDDVLVMHEDDRLRINRLALLARIGAMFSNIADFKKV